MKGKIEEETERRRNLNKFPRFVPPRTHKNLSTLFQIVTAPFVPSPFSSFLPPCVFQRLENQGDESPANAMLLAGKLGIIFPGPGHSDFNQVRLSACKGETYLWTRRLKGWHGTRYRRIHLPELFNSIKGRAAGVTCSPERSTNSRLRFILPLDDCWNSIKSKLASPSGLCFRVILAEPDPFLSIKEREILAVEFARWLAGILIETRLRYVPWDESRKKSKKQKSGNRQDEFQTLINRVYGRRTRRDDAEVKYFRLVLLVRIQLI